jgi:hypothetical protein
LGFGEGYVDFRVNKGYGEAGESGSGAQIEEGIAGADVLGGEEALAEVTGNYFVGVSDSGQVGAGVPLEEEVQVDG